MPINRAKISDVLLPHFPFDALSGDQANEQPIGDEANALLPSDAPAAARMQRAALAGAEARP